MPKIKSFDRPAVNAFVTEVDKAVTEACKRYGVEFRGFAANYSDTSCRLRGEAFIVSNRPKNEDFDSLLYGLAPVGTAVKVSIRGRMENGTIIRVGRTHYAIEFPRIDRRYRVPFREALSA